LADREGNGSAKLSNYDAEDGGVGGGGGGVGGLLLVGASQAGWEGDIGLHLQGRGGKRKGLGKREFRGRTGKA